MMDLARLALGTLSSNLTKGISDAFISSKMQSKTSAASAAAQM